MVLAPLLSFGAWSTVMLLASIFVGFNMSPFWFGLAVLTGVQIVASANEGDVAWNVQQTNPAAEWRLTLRRKSLAADIHQCLLVQAGLLGVVFSALLTIDMFRYAFMVSSVVFAPIAEAQSNLATLRQGAFQSWIVLSADSWIMMTAHRVVFSYLLCQVLCAFLAVIVGSFVTNGDVGDVGDGDPISESDVMTAAQELLTVLRERGLANVQNSDDEGESSSPSEVADEVSVRQVEIVIGDDSGQQKERPEGHLCVHHETSVDDCPEGAVLGALWQTMCKKTGRNVEHSNDDKNDKNDDDEDEDDDDDAGVEPQVHVIIGSDGDDWMHLLTQYLADTGVTNEQLLALLKRVLGQDGGVDADVQTTGETDTNVDTDDDNSADSDNDTDAVADKQIKQAVRDMLNKATTRTNANNEDVGDAYMSADHATDGVQTPSVAVECTDDGDNNQTRS